jgi:hypothetical protein
MIPSNSNPCISLPRAASPQPKDPPKILFGLPHLLKTMPEPLICHSGLDTRGCFRDGDEPFEPRRIGRDKTRSSSHTPCGVVGRLLCALV